MPSSQLSHAQGGVTMDRETCAASGLKNPGNSQSTPCHQYPPPRRLGRGALPIASADSPSSDQLFRHRRRPGPWLRRLHLRPRRPPSISHCLASLHCLLPAGHRRPSVVAGDCRAGCLQTSTAGRFLVLLRHWRHHRRPSAPRRRRPPWLPRQVGRSPACAPRPGRRLPECGRRCPRARRGWRRSGRSTAVGSTPGCSRWRAGRLAGARRS